MTPVNILLVDDRPEGLISLEAVLKNPEYNLISANSGKEALSHVLSTDFAVILMDVQMPEMDGFETTTIIKQREKSKNIPIIFMTANNRANHYISIGYSVGAVDYVLKPFDPHILKSKVAVFVELYRKTQLIKEQAEVLREVERRDRLRVLHDLEVEGRKRYQNLADAIPQIIFRANSRGEIEYLNQFWQKYTGLSVSSTNKDQWKDFLYPRDLVLLEQKWQESSLAQQGFEIECRLKEGSGGEFRWHLLRVIPELRNQSQLLSWIGVATEIHDQKLFQQELFEAKKMAEAANETKSNFLANMSHEIRTPLGIILGFSELLIDAGTSADEKASAITSIRKNGDLLSKIIDEILDLSKVEAGKMNLETDEVDLIDLLNSVKNFMTLPAKEKGIDLSFATDGIIPSRIYSNAIRLNQILVNLIGNAIKFSPQGNVAVTVSFLNEFEQLKVCVKDSGPGLTATQIQNLFHPFSQVDTSMTRKHGGTGLGLVLARKLARALGGDVTVDESLPGDGCNFVITLSAGYPPKTEFVDSIEIKSSSVVSSIAKQKNSLMGVNILLVEDSIDNQVLVSKFLSMAGAKIDVANNGVEGVEKAISGAHDIVLMDIQMPELDGYGAIRQLRQKGYGKPIVALTAHGMVEDRQKCFDIGSNQHLTKPVNRHELIQCVQSLV